MMLTGSRKVFVRCSSEI